MQACAGHDDRRAARCVELFAGRERDAGGGRERSGDTGRQHPAIGSERACGVDRFAVELLDEAVHQEQQRKDDGGNGGDDQEAGAAVA